jgi:hypothetical protein
MPRPSSCAGSSGAGTTARRDRETIMKYLTSAIKAGIVSEGPPVTPVDWPSGSTYIADMRTVGVMEAMIW